LTAVERSIRKTATESRKRDLYADYGLGTAAGGEDTFQYPKPGEVSTDTPNTLAASNNNNNESGPVPLDVPYDPLNPYGSWSTVAKPSSSSQAAKKKYEDKYHKEQKEDNPAGNNLNDESDDDTEQVNHFVIKEKQHEAVPKLSDDEQPNAKIVFKKRKTNEKSSRSRNIRKKTE
jgi:hypothetical protein